MEADILLRKSKACPVCRVPNGNGAKHCKACGTRFIPKAAKIRAEQTGPLDAGGRPLTKTCSCGATIGRTTRTCTCGRTFLGWRTRQKQAPQNVAFEVQQPRIDIEDRFRRTEPAPTVLDADCDFDAISAGGGLVLIFGQQSITLTPRQREIVRLEISGGDCG